MHRSKTASSFDQVVHADEHQPLAERNLWNARGVRLLRLNVGCSDHLGPLLGIVGNELAKFSGCARKHDAAQVAELSFQLGIGDGLVDLFVELGDDLGGRVLGSADAEPRACLISRYNLSDGRHVRQDFCSSGGRHRERA